MSEVDTRPLTPFTLSSHPSSPTLSSTSSPSSPCIFSSPAPNSNSNGTSIFTSSHSAAPLPSWLEALQAYVRTPSHEQEEHSKSGQDDFEDSNTSLDSDAYLTHHHIPTLLATFQSALSLHKPSQPHVYLSRLLTKVLAIDSGATKESYVTASIGASSTAAVHPQRPHAQSSPLPPHPASRNQNPPAFPSVSNLACALPPLHTNNNSNPSPSPITPATNAPLPSPPLSTPTSPFFRGVCGSMSRPTWPASNSKDSTGATNGVSETSANETDNSSTTNPDNKPNYTGIRTITSLCKMAPPLTNILLDAHRYFAMDIGGSLCKITFFEPSPDKVPAEQAAKLKQMIAYMNSSVCYGTTGKRDDELSFPFEGGRWHFMHFETRRMEGALKLLKENGMHAMPSLTLPATGGGAYKFSSLFQSQLGVTLEKRDEMKCLLTGLNFLLQHYEKECWYLKDPSRPLVSDKIYVPMRQEAGSQIFPYLLVNCGSGVSIIRVDSEDRFERVGGSCIGGGTYWGLARLLLRCTTFEQAMEMCMNGDFAKVDMLVGDIYGSHGYPSLGLHARTVACAFGKMVMAHDPAVVQGASNADVAASLLHMIGANIAQVAYLTAVKENTTRVIFAGNFLRQNLISSGFLSYSIDYWSGGKLRALFLEHEGYFGSLGALFSPE